MSRSRVLRRPTALVLGAALALPGALVTAAPAARAGSSTAGGTAAEAAGLAGPAEQVLRGARASAADPVRVVAQTVDRRGRPDWRVFEAETPTEAVEAVAKARAVPGVRHVGVDTEVHALGAATPYDDPRRGEQWALDTLKAEAAAAVSAGEGLTVAVIDTGVRADHEDFAQGTVLPGKNYVDDGRGELGTVDPDGHGTHVAGIIAAASSNGRGVAGLSRATILPLRVLGAGGKGGSVVNVASAIRDAADQGAKVINLSLGGAGGAEQLSAAVTYARDKGAVVVAAVGNSRQEGNPVEYPGALPGVLTVAASARGDAIAPFSNTGPHVELAAPGVGVLSLGHESADSYATKQGTSMATPYVAATVAMVLAKQPGLSPDDVEALLVRTARDVAAPGRDDESGAGVVDPLAALTASTKVKKGLVRYSERPRPGRGPANHSPVAQRDTAATTPGRPVTVDVARNDTDADGDPVTVTGTGRPSAGTAALTDDGVVYTPRPGWRGKDRFSYRVSDGRGGTSTAWVTVTVTPG